MKRQLPRGWVIGAVILVAGCGKSPAPAPVSETPPPPAERPALLEATGETTLADLLAKPRAELAALCEEWTERVQLQERNYRVGSAAFHLLPDTRLPLALPVWREAKFLPKAGFSLPPYLAEGNKDSVCAVHLARCGDVEAARRLVDPADRQAQDRIAALAPERNYPVEWTRLVALMLHSAQYRLASGDQDGAVQVIGLHRQLQKVLDARAADGPLGADLLARGHETLTQAARAWREGKQPALAEQAEMVLASWGKVPASTPAVTLGEARAAVARVLGGPGQGRLAAAASTLRALDLFALPFPAEGCQDVLAFFDGSDRLTDVLIIYRPGVCVAYPRPAQLAHLLADHAPPGVDGPEKAGLRSRTYQAGGLAWLVAIAGHSPSLGACVRVSDPWQSTTAPALGRDFGPVHLERSFEQARVQLAPGQQGDTLQVEQARSLALLKDPLRPAEKPRNAPPFTLAGATLQREPGHDVLGRLTLRYTAERDLPPLSEIARPLWTAYGTGQLAGIESPEGTHLALVWEDTRTRWVLSLPNAGGRTFDLEVADRRGADQLTARGQEAAATDRAERQARLKAGTPLTRLPRQVDVEWSTQPVPVVLGMTRDQVLQALPGGPSVVKQDMQGGLRVIYNGSPHTGPSARPVTHVLRELLVRWGPSGRATEVRARYEDGPSAATGNWVQGMLNAFRKRGGAPHEQPGPAAAVWADLPLRKPAPVVYRWQDDITALTFERDAGGAEVVLRDCPPEHPSGLVLPPLAILPRGPEGVSLGDMREGLLRRWNVGSTAARPDGSLALPISKPGPYDGILVWFDKDRVSRIVGRHGGESASFVRPADAGKALLGAWGREARQLGWPRRQDLAGEDLLQGLGSFDDRTRVRIFWQEGNDGTARLMTEWKALPE